MADLNTKICYFLLSIWNNPELDALSSDPINPTAIQYASFLLSIVICFIGLLGNAIVIGVTAFLMNDYKSKIWFLNLAVADFTFILFLPFNAISVLKAHWSYGLYMCKSYHFFTFVNMYASIYILIALNIDRALSIAKPIWHMRFLSKKICRSVCAVIWLSAALSSLPAFLNSEVYDHDGSVQCMLFANDLQNLVHIKNAFNTSDITLLQGLSEEICLHSMELVNNDPLWNNITSTTTGLLVSLLVIGYFIPLCIILVTNLVIAVHVKNSLSGPLSRLYSVVIAAIMAFFCSRTPLVLGQIIFLASAHALELTLMYKVLMLLPLLSSIAAINSCLNPIIYVLIGNQIRNLICSVLKKF